MEPRDRLIVALDTPSLAAAEAIADRLQGTVRWFKVGAELFTAAGPAALAAVARRGQVFLDLKYHDIPSTVASAVASGARQGVGLCTVHAAGGLAMMQAAREAAGRAPVLSGQSPLRLVGVTLLTSIDAAALREVGIMHSPLDVTLHLARLSQSAGLAGVITSPLEVGPLRDACGRDFLLICPGIRPRGTGLDDQRRALAPREAVAAGADMLVVGRPVVQAPDPQAAAEEIIREIATA